MNQNAGKYNTILQPSTFKHSDKYSFVVLFVAIIQLDSSCSSTIHWVFH